jgi:hypothetical protein
MNDSVSEEKPVVEKKPVKAATTEEIVTNFLTALSSYDQCPAQVRPYLKQAAPHIGKLVQKIEDAIPFIYKLYLLALEYWEKLRPYKPELLIPSLVGFVMCFFGGSYLTLIAAVEAYRMVGFDATYNCIVMLIEDFKKIVEATKKDDSEDKDNDGIADVNQISSQQLVTRKMLLFLRTVDPNRLTVAIAGINAGFLAVIATLKIKFAKTITLGNAIGEMIEGPVDHYVLPHIEKVVPDDYRRWVKPTIHYSIRTGAISFAWFIQRIISAFHSAMRGGLMFSRSILAYLSAMDIYHLDDKDTYLDEIVGYGLAALGLFFQLSTGFSLPFPLNILLFPFTLMEYFCIYCVTSFK